MKTSERHHLKDNELALAINRAKDMAERHQRNLKIAAAALVLIAMTAAGFFAWRNRVESAARESLAQAMVVAEARVMAPTPGAAEGAPVTQTAGTYPTEKAKLEAALPKFLATADAHPSSDAGKTARYHAATTLVALGRFDEATKQYDQLMGAGGLLGQSARLGKAEAELRSGKHDAAIATFKELSDRTDTNLPKEAILLELARAYRAAGKNEDARKTLNQIVEQHADSPFAQTAKTEMEKITGNPELEKAKG